MGNGTGRGHAQLKSDHSAWPGPPPTNTSWPASYLYRGLKPGSALLRPPPLSRLPRPGSRLHRHRGFTARDASRTPLYQRAQSRRARLDVGSTIRYVDRPRPARACARRGSGTQPRGTARDLLQPRPAGPQWGCWENYTIPALGPELLMQFPALSARIQSSCHHTELVPRKLKVAMLYDSTWPETRGEMLPESYLQKITGIDNFMCVRFPPKAFSWNFWRLPVTATLSSLPCPLPKRTLTTPHAATALCQSVREVCGEFWSFKAGTLRRFPEIKRKAPPLGPRSSHCACQVCVPLPQSATGREAAAAAKGAERQERGGTRPGPRVVRAVGFSPRRR